MSGFIAKIIMWPLRLSKVALSRIKRYIAPSISPQAGALHRPKTAAQKTIQHQVEQTIVKFENDDFAGIRAQFHLVLRLLCPEAMLRKGWKLIQVTAGPILSIGTPSISTSWLVNTAHVPVQFKRMKMTMAMQITKSGTVVGLRFLPSNLAAFGLGNTKSEWRRPEYDLPESYEEIDISLGPRGNAVGATLTLPRTAKQSPCIVLLGGSGPCDRDSTVQAAKPFKDIACGLARMGVATLRFDKVTFTHGRKVARNPNFTLSDEYCEHATAAIKAAIQHPRIAPGKIFLAGHSLGSVVTPKLATSETAVAGLILMAPPAGSLYWSAIHQFEYFSRLESTVDDNKDDVGLRELRKAALRADSPDLSESTPADELPFGIGPSYWLDYRTFEPIATTRACGKPVLLLQGEEDYQVTMRDDYAHWKAALEGVSSVDLRSYESLNHLFMHCIGPSKPTDYENACNVERFVIDDIAQWVLAKT